MSDEPIPERVTDLTVHTLFAFLITDPADNVEGLAAVLHDGAWTPMVGADLDRVEMLRPQAEALAKALGVKVTLAHFTAREDVETIEPKPS